MNKIARSGLILAAIVLPLIVAGCFSSNPTRTGNGDTGSTTSQGGSGGRGSDTGIETGQQGSGQQGSNGTLGGHRGVPDSPGGESGTFGLPKPGANSGQQGDGDGDGSSDIRVATADTSSAEGDADEGGENGLGGSALPDQPEVSVAEALEGANAAVDAAAEAVAEAESTIARAREHEAAGGGGETETFDPWAPTGASESDESDKAEDGQSEADQDAESTSIGRQRDDEAEDDSFDPFARYGDQEGENRRSLSSSNSLQTADDAVAAARAALNRARRSLIEAAGSGSGDADAEAVQLGAARAAMEAAAEAVIAAAIAVMAASDAFADEDSDFASEEAEGAQDRMAESIAMVVAITERDMDNAAEALEATAELLSAAGSLIGMLGNQPQEKDDVDGSEAGAERVASLEKQLDQSLAVFDDRMEVESRNVGGTMASEDSEIAGLSLPDGAKGSSRQRSNSAMANPKNSGRVIDEQEVVNPDIKARYDAPDMIEQTETEQIVIAEGRPQDDDIVARQLREAAMAETDPELREALWKEYKNYKESLETGEAEANP